MSIKGNRPDQNQQGPVDQQNQQTTASTRLAGTSTMVMTERNYERIDTNDTTLFTSSIAIAGLMNTPRLMDAKEQKRREKEMRRLAKLRMEAELKEAKLQAKLAKKQAKRGEPVALGILHTLQSDGNLKLKFQQKRI